MSRRRFLLLVFALLLLVYVGSYGFLSRRGFAEADRYHDKGFDFFTPEPTKAWRFKNYACVCVYYPLILLDNAVGTGRWPGAEPLWGLSK